jgi:hypothetical protein
MHPWPINQLRSRLGEPLERSAWRLPPPGRRGPGTGDHLQRGGWPAS